ncbi:MAG: hypothetical protein HY541_05535 [Deltaproteobacteria bacterium]|nr:hypothetical protein [Deltaproteobacteria bacterium]
MLLALKIWCLVFLGFVAVSLIGGFISSSRHQDSLTSIKHLFNPVHWTHRHRKAA